jgi:predicted RecA/RadA family phage recombinase
MAVVPVRFRHPDRLRPDQSSEVRKVLVTAWQAAPAGEAVEAFFEGAFASLDASTSTPVQKGFVMAYMDFVEAVSDHLASSKVSRRPLMAVRLWLRCIGRLDPKTNIIQASRQELADSLGMPASEVSRTMAELVRIQAVIRVSSRAGVPRGSSVVRYKLNEAAANHYGERDGRDARVAAAPRLILLDGGASSSTERRSRARSFQPVPL